MSTSRKTKHVKSQKQLEEAVQQQTPEDTWEIEPVVEAEAVQKMSPEAMEKFWTAIHASNELVLANTLENVDRIIGLVITDLRAHKEVTQHLREAEALMYNFEGFAARHRFTLPQAMSAYYGMLLKLTHLADINQLKIEGAWPVDANGMGRTLSPMQHSILWS